MKKLAITLITVSSLAVIVSCSYNKNELPEPIVESVTVPVVTPVNPVTPTSSGAITYTSHIKSMVDNNCVVCHGSSGGITLQTYSQVKSQADAGRILARAINGSGTGPMPPSGLMPQTNLDTLQMWLDQGALE
tara:strand:+ start:3957 stop:4355 length:399 start_codon:yes stop_codon:yes gene_type:complete